jgi:Glycosyltransferases, probably involved in cell wall biogenesis
LITHWIFGSSIWTAALGICAISIITGGFILPAAITILHQRFWYDRILRKRYNASYNPRCSIILPCKGVPENLETNLKAFLDLAYVNFEIIFTVESEEDLAFSSISRLITPYPKASVVVAGKAAQCGQKNFNQLAAIKNAKVPDVYVFADIDICPQKQWLNELVLPLSNKKITAVTGFRWNRPAHETMGEYVHTYLNIFLYIWMTTINFFGGAFLWGGSMAIRKKDFEDLKVAECWKHAVVDDNSLSRILMKKLKRTVVVPACVTATDDLLASVSKSIFWFTRQVMYLKAHEKPLWFFGALPLVLIAFFLYTWLPLSLVLSAGSAKTFFNMGGGATLIFYAGGLFIVPLFPVLGPLPGLYKMFFIEPLLRFTIVISLFKTAVTNKIIWSGIKYHLTFSGTVAKVERLDGN